MASIKKGTNMGKDTVNPLRIRSCTEWIFYFADLNSG